MSTWSMLDDIMSFEFEMWRSRILVASLVTGFIWGGHKIIVAGRNEMLADPPRVLVDKDHTVRAYSCGNNCVTNSDYWVLYDGSGATCRVSRSEYARARIGQEWKCTQLFGWHD